VRDGATASYLFVLNHSDAPVEVPLDHAGATDLLTGEPAGATLALPGLGVAVLRLPRDAG